MAGSVTNTKGAIEFVCNVLHFFGIRSVTAEEFRRAKYNDAEAVPRFWALLKALFKLSLVIPGDGTSPSEYPTCDLSLVEEPSSAEKTRVLLLLAGAGYPRADVLVSYPVGARELLLAVGFLIDSCEIFEAYRRASRELQARTCADTVPLPPYPLDVSHMPSVVRGASDCVAALRRRTMQIGSSSQVASTSGVEHGHGRGKGASNQSRDVQDLCHIALQLYGRWRAEASHAEALDLHRLSLLQKLRNVGMRSLKCTGRQGAGDSPEGLVNRASLGGGVAKQEPPSQYELYVLEREALCEQHITLLLEESRSLTSWHKEEVFWKWMASALRTAENEAEAPAPASIACREGHASSDADDKLRRMCEHFAGFESCLASLRYSLRKGFLARDTEWQWLQDLYDRDSQAASSSTSSAEGFLEFLRGHCDRQKRKLPPQLQLDLKPRLRSLGLAFDAAVPAPWRAGCVSHPEAVELLHAMAAEGRAAYCRGLDVGDDAPAPTAQPPAGRLGTFAEVQRQVAEVMAQYNCAAESCGPARQAVLSDLEGCLKLATACGVHVLQAPKPRLPAKR